MNCRLISTLLLLTFLTGCSMQNDEQNLRSFIDRHVQVVEPKIKALNLASWNASATGEKKFYDEQAALEIEVNKIYSDKGEFEQLKKWKEGGTIRDSILQRELVILYNSYLKNQIDTSLMRRIAEKSAEIANTFNVFRATIDGKELTDNELEEILKKETNNARRKKAWEASKVVGEAVAPMVIELVKLRNEAARQLGFRDYYVMSLTASEQNVDEIAALFDDLKKMTDEPYARLKARIDSELAKKWNVAVSAMRPWHYQDRFFQEAPLIGTVNVDRYFKEKKIDEIGASFYSKIGLPVEDVLINSDLYERKGKYQHAFETDIDRKGDIRVMLNIKNDQNWMATTLHELGHAVFSKYIDRSLPYLLRVESHTFLTEAVAMLMERQANNADWLQQMAAVPEKEKEKIRRVGDENLMMHGLIFSRWTQVMMRFERSMYENPDQDLNKLWWDLVEKYQLIHRPEGRNAPDWAAKIHLAQYPAYYHNYELGELAASQLQHIIAAVVLKGQAGPEPSYAGRTEVGDFLKNRVFKPGASLRWDTLVRYATGEPLTPKYFAEDFIR